MSFGRFQFRRDTTTNWTAANPVLAAGELGLDTDEMLFKIGDGTTAWNDLLFVGGVGATGATGATGAQGDPGLSAYEVAVANGYTGTQADWLASLVGPQGPTGATGAAGPGVASGGTTGQVLRKASATDYDTSWLTLATVATSGAYSDLTGAPTIPDATSDLTNDSGFITTAGARSAISATGSLSYNSTTGVVSYTAPTAVSAFTNDAGYLTGITGTQVTTALGFTPYDSSNPSGYTSNTGTVTSVAASGGTTGLSFSGSPITTSGTLTLSGTLAVANGGTGQTSYTDGQLLIGNSTGNTLAKATLTAGTGISVTNGAGSITIANSAPDQTVSLTAGTGISVTGSYPSFTIATTGSGTGTVTSVGLTAPTGFSVSGSPVTSSGILALSFSAGYSLPTDTKQGQWDTAYGWGNHATAGYLTTSVAASSYQPLDGDLTAISGLAGTSGLLKKTAANTWSLDTSSYLTANQSISFSGDASGSGSTAVTLTLATVNSNIGTFNNVTVNAKGLVTAASNVSYLTGNQTITLSGDVTGSGATAITATLANSGVTAGTYKSVTVDAKGRVTAGTNPTTLAGYGITDAAPAASPTFTGTATFATTDLLGSVRSNVTAVSASAIDCSAGNFFTKTASGALTWTVTNVPASRAFSFILELTNGGTGTQTWFSGIKWPGGTAPTLTASGVDVLGFITDDSGTTWRGVQLMKDSK